jgi:excisionase family DNA binding protein
MQTHNSSTMANQLLKCPEVARILDQKVSTIYAWCRSGKLPQLRLSRRSYRVRQSDLERFLNAHAR